jgi:branched-chain amino acid aminotransferase
MSLICFNGNYLPADQPLFTVQNRGFKYGDGVFETIKVFRNEVLLAQYHMERLFTGLRLLNIKFESRINEDHLLSSVVDLCQANNCSELSRVRLAVFRNDLGEAEYVIEALPLSEEVNQWGGGYRLDIYPYVRKSIDALSNLKTANFLPYILAADYAANKGLDDCMVLNSDNHICDSSKANIFLIRNREIFTPSLDQGCINGVMRRFLIEKLKNLSYIVHQQAIREQDLLEADEAFLTNSIYDLRWIKSFGTKEYGYTTAYSIYHQIFPFIYASGTSP